MPSRASRISSGRMLNSVPTCSSGNRSHSAGSGGRPAGKFAAHLGELPGDTAVDDLVADPDSETTDERGIDDHLQPDFAAERPAERLSPVALLVVGELHRRVYVGYQSLPSLRGELRQVTERGLDRPAARLDDGPLQQAVAHVVDLAVEQPVQQL